VRRPKLNIQKRIFAAFAFAFAFLTCSLSLSKKKRGMVGLVIALIIGVLTALIGTMVGLVVFANFAVNGVDTLVLGTSGNATRTTIETQGYTALNLMSLMPLILVASAMIAAVASIGMYAYSKRGA